MAKGAYTRGLSAVVNRIWTLSNSAEQCRIPMTGGGEPDGERDAEQCRAVAKDDKPALYHKISGCGPI